MLQFTFELSLLQLYFKLSICADKVLKKHKGWNFMRRSSSIFIILIISSLLMACSDEFVNEAIVIEQNDKEDLQLDMLHLLADELGVWDITINDKAAKEIEVTVEHYEHSKKQDPIVQFSTFIDEPKSKHKVNLVIAEQSFEEQSKWIAAIISEDSLAASESIAPFWGDFQTITHSTVPVPTTAEVGEKVVLGTIMLTNSEEHISTHIPFDEDFDEKDLEEINHTYIMSLQVK